MTTFTSAEEQAIDLLRGMLTTGEAIVDGRYVRPTLYNLVPAIPGAAISQRADHRIAFAFDERDGARVSYEGTVSQDDLFRVLHGAGLIKRRDTGRKRRVPREEVAA